ncbi:sulfatase family protein [Candidatus Colwellia aromaticivorans]|uniref:sulfatase family protein n=1 Tax=Candidatus Colwellia aromaticivorans TaxID=2267621 RepID=UPI000DF2572F|nr:sulfatase [Candidatus Colwellia aromaticivorans]
MKNFTKVSLGLIAISFTVSAIASEQKRPNILFVFADDHATHSISAYGSKINKTPNIDKLASEGVLFRNAFATNSICGPSRAVILTGKHSHKNGFMNNEWGGDFDGSQQTFPKLLQKAGYQTSLIGKWHLYSKPTGFDHWEILPGQGRYYNPRFKSESGTIEVEGYTTDVITDRAVDWLDKRDKTKPFMLMYQHKAPHREWAPGPDHIDKYKYIEIPEPATLFDDHKGRAASLSPDLEMSVAEYLTMKDLKLEPPGYLNDAQLANWNRAYAAENKAYQENKPQGDARTKWRYQRYIKDYMRSVDSIDDNLGRVMAYLKENNLEENTIVIYSSDQGFFLGDHGWFDKRWMYEDSINMPLIVKWPGKIKPGSENSDLVQNLDFAQTFLDIAGVAAPDDMQGKSLVPLMSAAAESTAKITPFRDAIYYHFYENPGWAFVPRHYGVRTDRYKLIHFYQLGTWEFYDLASDPDELNNRIADKSQSANISQLKKRLTELRKEYQVPIEDPEPTLLERLKFWVVHKGLSSQLEP